MGQSTKIEWATHSHNLWWGCDEIRDPGAEDGIDPACRFCYARTRAENPYWWGKETMFPVWGQDVGRRWFSDKHYSEPLRWNRAAERAGKPATVFCVSMGDWAEGRPDQRPILDKHLFPTIEATPYLIWLLLTKRPQIAATIVPEHWKRNGWPKNAWPGTTAVNQKWWDLRVPALLKIPASRHFVSVEPMMGPIQMGSLQPDWAIAGGESGKHARPAHPDWFRSLRDQSYERGVKFFFKQWGEFRTVGCADWDASDVDDDAVMTANEDRVVRVWPDGRVDDGEALTDERGGFFMERVGTKRAGRLLDGREWNEMPEFQV